MKKNVGLLIKSLVILWWLWFTLITTLNHEPWHDEIVSWLISKWKIKDIIYEMRFEGHFVLWNIILAPFAKNDFPLITLCVISWIINTAGVIYFLKMAPFGWIIKLIIIFTSPFLYINPVVSRPYVMIPGLIFLVAHLLFKAMSDVHHGSISFFGVSLVLAILANTHIYVEGFTGSVGILLLCNTIKNWKEYTKNEKKVRVLSIFIMLLGAMVAFIQIAPSIFTSVIFKSGDAYVGQPLDFFVGSGITNSFLQIVLTVLLIICIIYFFFRDFKVGFIVVVSELYMLFVCCFVYYASIPNRAVMWFYFIIFGFWVVWDTNNIVDRNFIDKVFLGILVLIAMFLFNPILNIHDIKNYYDGEGEFSEYICETVPKGATIWCSSGGNCTAMMIDYLKDYSLYNIATGSELQFRRDNYFEETKVVEYIETAFQKEKTDSIWVVDTVFVDKRRGFVEELEIPYEYECMYPNSVSSQKEYTFSYYLYKVYR